MYVFSKFFKKELFAHSLFFIERCEQIAQIAHQYERCEQIAQVNHKKKSDSLRKPMSEFPNLKLSNCLVTITHKGEMNVSYSEYWTKLLYCWNGLETTNQHFHRNLSWYHSEFSKTSSFVQTCSLANWEFIKTPFCRNHFSIQPRVVRINKHRLGVSLISDRGMTYWLHE